MTEWERTGNTYWRDRILNGVKDMLALGRNGLPSSGGLYNITTGRFMTLKASATQAAPGARGSMNAPASDFAPAADVIRTTPSQDQASAPAARRMGGGPGYFDMIFGAPEIMAELLPMLNYEPFREAWLKVCQSLANTTGNQMTGPRMAAWAYHLSGDTQMGERPGNNFWTIPRMRLPSVLAGSGHSGEHPVAPSCGRPDFPRPLSRLATPQPILHAMGPECP
jgi:hypothetical protein